MLICSINQHVNICPTYSGKDLWCEDNYANVVWFFWGFGFGCFRIFLFPLLFITTICKKQKKRELWNVRNSLSWKNENNATILSSSSSNTRYSARAMTMDMVRHIQDQVPKHIVVVVVDGFTYFFVCSSWHWLANAEKYGIFALLPIPNCPLLSLLDSLLKKESLKHNAIARCLLMLNSTCMTIYVCVSRCILFYSHKQNLSHMTD